MVGNNSGGGLINVVDQVCFPFIGLDVTLCRDSIHCPFESGLSPLSVVLLEAGIKVWCNPHVPHLALFAF